MLVCRHPGLFFRVHPASRKFFFFIIEMKKIALILIYNMFVTKKGFQEWTSKKIFDLHISCRPVRWRQTNIFLSLALFQFMINFSRFMKKVRSLELYLKNILSTKPASTMSLEKPFYDMPLLVSSTESWLNLENPFKISYSCCGWNVHWQPCGWSFLDNEVVNVGYVFSL